MARLYGFDYKTPFYYMVTLKRLNGLLPLSQIGPEGLVENEITAAFNANISSFHRTWHCIDAITSFVVMPDHIHLLIRIRDVQPRKSLPILVWQLARALSRAYWAIAVGRSAGDGYARPRSPSTQSVVLRGAAVPASSPPFCGGRLRPPPLPSAEGARPRPIFASEWHDWIVKKRGQLETFRRYILENPARAWLRRANAHYFGRVSEVDFCGRRWFAYGNAALLDLPVIQPFKCSRSLVKDSPEWNAFTAAAARIGPGGAGVGTFMNPCEKECGNAIARAGGSWIVLSPEGFGPRWHPPREKERFCATGRMLFLSLYEAMTRQPTRAELYHRCHEMIDLALTGLS